MKTLSLTPAFGRDYASKGKAVHAWQTGQDFRNETVGVSGQYVSVRDMETLRREGFTHVSIRYNRLTRVVVVHLV